MRPAQITGTDPQRACSADTYTTGTFGPVGRVRTRSRQTSQADSPTSENDQRTHPLPTIRTTRTVADADARNPND